MPAPSQKVYEVEVIYAVRRKVYIEASSPTVARKLAAQGPVSWLDAGEVHEDIDTVRLPTHRILEGTI